MSSKSPETVSGPVALGADHAGLPLKEAVKEHLVRRGLKVLDLGTHSPDSVDYPDHAVKVAKAILAGEALSGVLVCGTGIGMSIMANRFRGIRAALCHDHFTAVASRAHNNANVLVLGGRLLGLGLAEEIVDAWLATPFEGGRHQRRVEKLEQGKA